MICFCLDCFSSLTKVEGGSELASTWAEHVDVGRFPGTARSAHRQPESERHPRVEAPSDAGEELRQHCEVSLKIKINSLASQLRKMSLKSTYLLRSINKKKALFERVVEPVSRRSTLPADGEELLRNMSIKHMQALVRDACRGSLAEVDEPDVFEQRIATLETVPQFSSALLEFFEAIPKK